MRKLIRVLMGLALLGGLLAVAPQAKAQNAVTCAVDGTVEITSGAPLNNNARSRGHVFVATNIDCVGTAFGATIHARYQVEASGSSTGAEVCASGEGSGTLTADKTLSLSPLDNGPDVITGDYDFLREGSVVVVTGELTADGDSADLAAVLQFTPMPPTDAVGCQGEDDEEGITDAQLTGVAVIGP